MCYLCKYIEMRVVAAVIRNGDEFLACRRAPHKNLAGKWEFPGGKVEISESDQQALVREIKEELNVDILVGDLVTVSTNTSGTTEIVMYSYLAKLHAEKPVKSSDHDQMMWVTKADLASLDWAELDVPVIEALLKIKLQ